MSNVTSIEDIADLHHMLRLMCTIPAPKGSSLYAMAKSDESEEYEPAEYTYRDTGEYVHLTECEAAGGASAFLQNRFQHKLGEVPFAIILVKLLHPPTDREVGGAWDLPLVDRMRTIKNRAVMRVAMDMQRELRLPIDFCVEYVRYWGGMRGKLTSDSVQQGEGVSRRSTYYWAASAKKWLSVMYSRAISRV